MAGILGAIRSHNGIVIVSDSQTDPLQSTAVFEINSKCVAAVFRERKTVRQFLDKYIIPKKLETVTDVITLINEQLTKHSEEYVKSNFSFFITGYENGRSVYYSIWFENKKINFMEIDKISHFINTIEDLAIYIISKVFSEQLNIEELKNLTIFVTLQCIKVFGLDSFFDITTIDENGVKKLSEGEVKDRLSLQDKKDNKLKKLFSDFFVQEINNK